MNITENFSKNEFISYSKYQYVDNFIAIMLPNLKKQEFFEIQTAKDSCRVYFNCVAAFCYFDGKGRNYKLCEHFKVFSQKTINDLFVILDRPLAVFIIPNSSINMNPDELAKKIRSFHKVPKFYHKNI